MVLDNLEKLILRLFKGEERPVPIEINRDHFCPYKARIGINTRCEITRKPCIKYFQYDKCKHYVDHTT